MIDVDELAQEIRRVDGNHTLGAGALAEALLPFLSARRSPVPEGDGLRPTHRHVKRGSEYVLIGYGKMQAEGWYVPTNGSGPAFPIDSEPADMREVAIYRSVDDGSLWVRPREEFDDGRFVALASPAPVKAEAEVVGARPHTLTPMQLDMLSFVLFYSSTFCAPQNIDAVVKEIDCCPGCDFVSTSGSTCYKFERGEYCPNLVAEDLRQISAALYGPDRPTHYTPRERPGEFATPSSGGRREALEAEDAEFENVSRAEFAATVERYGKALALIASHAGKTLVSIEHGKAYSLGANAAFEDVAEHARAALANTNPTGAE